MASRPISPHLQIYRWYFTMALSIAHRATGIALSVGALFLAWWLVALATGPGTFGTVQWLVASWIGQLALFGWTFVIFFHCANGIRHLVWDTGYGLDVRTAHWSGRIVVGAAVVLTALVWLVTLLLR